MRVSSTRGAGTIALAVLLGIYAALPGGAAARAADPRWQHRIVSGYVPVERQFGFDLERRMNDLGAQGFRVATVVQPRPPLLAEEATVILARDTNAPAAPVQFAVLAADTPNELQERAAARARDGFAVAALTVTQGFRQPAGRRGDAVQFYDLSQHAARYVALLEHVPGVAPRPVRIIQAKTEKGGWDDFIAATRASFRVTQSLWLGPNTVNRERERLLFLMHDEGSGVAYETSVPATTPRTDLDSHIDKYEKRGFEMESLWTVLDTVEVLFIKPLGRRALPGSAHTAQTSNMDESILLSSNGRLTGVGYAIDEGKLQRHFVQDTRAQGYSYEGITGVFPRSRDHEGQLGGVGFVGLGPPPETEQTCAACLALDVSGERGYRAVWAAVGPGYKFDRRMEVVLERYRP